MTFICQLFFFLPVGFDKLLSKIMKYTASDKISRVVKVWLAIGIVMVFFQVVIGGVTRLTGSGLSITKWEIVTGTLPPLNKGQWEKEFDLYKATPQYEKINKGMSLSQFKFIYFWEYFHRLWARTIGLVFLFPFLYFLFMGKLSRSLIKDLGIVIVLAVTVASIGWIMVASGLIDRPWVNAYKLSFHLSLALILLSYLLWTTFKVYSPRPKVFHNPLLRKLSLALLVLLGLQIFLGGIMSGMKAGLFYPTWPDMHGELIPSVLRNGESWNVDNFLNYDKGLFMPALIQLSHRSLAYLLIIIGLYYIYMGQKADISTKYRKGLYMLISMLVIQILLGIVTVLKCKGSIPVDFGVYHQAGAMLLLGITLFMVYLSPKDRY